MKSIIAADIFISGLPYSITNSFQGFQEEFILWASLSVQLRMCRLDVQHVSRGGGFVAIGLRLFQ